MAGAAPRPSGIPSPLRIVKPKREPTKAYDAFVVYYELGEARDIKKVGEKLGVGWENVRKFRQKWSWDDRIEAHENEAKAQFRVALRERAAEMADEVIALRIKILEKQLKAAEAIQAKADLITSLPVTEQHITQTSPDGKTTHITIKPINCRATDGGRLTLMVDALLRSLTQQTNPQPAGRGAFSEDGVPSAKQPPLPVEVFLANGDGTRGNWNDLPPPDEYVPGDDEKDDDNDSDDEPPGVPSGTPKV